MAEYQRTMILLPSTKGFFLDRLLYWTPGLGYPDWNHSKEQEDGYWLFFEDGHSLHISGADSAAFTAWLEAQERGI